jgi:hypothetical protein
MSPMTLLSFGRRLGAGALVLLLAACVPTSRIQSVEKLADVPAGETVLVGRIELDPPLRPGEQKLSERYAEFDRVALVIVGDEPRPMERLALGDLKQRINAPFGQHFFVNHPAQPLYILKSWVVMQAEIKVQSPNARTDDGLAPLQGMFRIDVKSGDKAVYIGTIRYHRDEFFGTTRVQVRDDFASANAEFQRRFGRTLSLRKSLAVPVRP